MNFSPAECLVMGLLHSGARYGHEIDKYMEQMKIRYWTKTNRATIYQTLQRIERKGWVTSETEVVGNMPRRKIYTLTPKGKKALQEMVFAGLASQEIVTFDYSIAIGWLEVLPTQLVIDQVIQRKSFVEKIIHQFSQEDVEDTDIYIGRRANVRFLKSYYEMEREWLDWLLRELRKLKKTV